MNQYYAVIQTTNGIVWSTHDTPEAAKFYAAQYNRLTTPDHEAVWIDKTTTPATVTKIEETT